MAGLDEVDWNLIYDGDDKQKFEKRNLANATEARDAMPENTKRSLVPKQAVIATPCPNDQNFLCVVGWQLV